MSQTIQRRKRPFPVTVIAVVNTLGWLMANTIWVYSMTFTLARDLYVGLTTGTVVFLFFAVFALASTAYLWVRRTWFWQEP